ncbi:PX domain-containing protein kinase-like protein [Exaiptasia diaphana]|uniref:PX domain-containing protein n=1 Tax=Exaiptasia diaphana TaxID=2652724 RepID=A0A913XZK5_EXADI|nr:PX domain-containing protein kinase-like protein [Exaiptasia diaphana]
MARRSKRNTVVDDTIPLMCIFEGIDKKEYVDYIIKVQRGANPEDNWQVLHRYSDFATLQATLEPSGIELPLPPKKVFGNMDSTFIAERQQGLQSYIHFIMAHPLLARHISVKKFLDPVNYSEDFQEKSMQHVAMFLRSVPNWEIVEPLPDIGWRLRKDYFLIKPTDSTKKDVRSILSWTEFGSDFCIEEKDMETLIKVFPNIQHPYIYPTGFTTSTEHGIITVRNFLPEGTLRDILCKAKPKVNQLKKYGTPKTRVQLAVPQIQIYGKQILEALKFLHDKGFPYGHLHTGNIAIEGNVCKLLEIENGLLGIPSIHRNRYVPYKKIVDKESEDVYCFAHVLYEMAFSEPLRTSTLSQLPPTCPSELRPVLESILNEEVLSKKGLPTVEELLELPFFKSVNLPLTEKPVMKIPSKVKESVRMAKEKSEQRLKEDQKFLRQFRRASKAHAHHMSEEEKKKRKKSAKKSHKSDSSAPAPQTGSAPSSPPPTVRSQPTVAPAAPPPPQAPRAPPPPAASAQTPAKSTSPPSSAGRGALLSSIAGFRKGGLKKAVTVDKSAPKLT